MKKMKALVFKEVGKLVLEERPVPQIKEPDDVIIKGLSGWHLRYGCQDHGR